MTKQRMVRVRFVQLMASPTRTAQIGDVVDLPAAEAEKRIRARQCVPVDGPPTTARAAAAAQEPEGNDPGAGDRGAGTAGEGEDLEAMKVPELRALAAERGVDLGAATRKADIVDALQKAEQQENEGDDPDPEEPGGGENKGG